MFRKTPKILVMVIIAGLVLAACGGNTPAENDVENTAADNSSSSSNMDSNTDDASSNSDAADVDEASVMEVDTPLSAGAVLDPALAADGDTAVLTASSYLYDTLVMNSGDEIGEGLAIEWSASDDGLTYEFQLRANAVFSDGTPINTDTVIENFTRWFDPEHSLHGDSAGYVAWVKYFDDFLVKDLAEGEAPPSKFDGAEKVDNLVFLLHLNEPMGDFLDILAMPQFSILNPDALAGADYGTNADSVVGSGAYVIDEWGSDSFVLVPNADYWGSAGGSDMIVFSVK